MQLGEAITERTFLPRRQYHAPLLCPIQSSTKAPSRNSCLCLPGDFCNQVSMNGSTASFAVPEEIRTKELCQGNALPASVIFQQNYKWVFPRLGNQQQGLFSLRRFSLSLPCWSQGRGAHLLHDHAHRLCLWGTYFNLTLIFYIMPNLTEGWEFISVHFYVFSHKFTSYLWCCR